MHAEWQAKDASKHASKASEKSACIDDKLSKINSMYGAQGILNKPAVSESDSVSSTKNYLKGGSPAKKSRVEDTHPAHAESPHVKSGQRQMKLPEMLVHQGSYPTKTPPKKPTRQGSRSMERPSKSSFEQDLLASDLRRKIDACHTKPKVNLTFTPFTHPPPGLNFPPPLPNQATLPPPHPPVKNPGTPCQKLPKKPRIAWFSRPIRQTRLKLLGWTIRPKI